MANIQNNSPYRIVHFHRMTSRQKIVFVFRLRHCQRGLLVLGGVREPESAGSGG
jgi:hypothetical protein